jgi:hypothetical protein
MLNQSKIKWAIVGICVAQCRGPDEVRQAVKNCVTVNFGRSQGMDFSLIPVDSLNSHAPEFRRADGLKVAAI